MPWEIGYFDGLKGVISILPIVKTEDQAFDGQEFLGLYPYIDYIDDYVMFVNSGNAPIETLGRLSKAENFRHFKDWMQERAG